MGKINITKEQIDFLIKNYSNKGVEGCATSLKLDKKVVQRKVRSLRLKLSTKKFNELQGFKSLKTNYANIGQFLDLTDPKMVYLMGLMWADGYLHDTKNRFELYIDKNDFNDVYGIIKEIGDWSIHERNRKDRKPSIVVGCYTRSVCDLMREYGFTEKSLKQPLFLNRIPKELKHYFFRGLIDGDGCFYISPDKKCRQFTLAGSFNQEWDYFTDFLNEFNIKYKVKQKTQKNDTQHYSVVFLSGKELVKLGDITYENFKVDNIGFIRKYDKYIDIKNSFK